ncbi:unnamed protein product [Oikopleura dioica]|uniref:Plastocyanin-like domain-containing protein n=1 Tax=Oikopleura dioica TaxID=34765 RepID=E4YP43_OIKDI|nr:unnamed protein product [Oikopleura dioica]
MLDGREERRIITINNHFPGPVIRVRKGAAVIVNVKNEMPIQAATVHWHGILMTNNFWMDGAAFINQCPILPHQQFTYSWKAENAGTFWYHTHFRALKKKVGAGSALISS